MTTRQEIASWYDEGVSQGATHMAVFCDTFDNDDYPVYVRPGEDPHEVVDRTEGQPMTRLMEVYWLGGDKVSQLSASRTVNYGPAAR